MKLTPLRNAAQHVQHMQKALEQMNVKLTEVVSDVSGLTAAPSNKRTCGTFSIVAAHHRVKGLEIGPPFQVQGDSTRA